MTLEYLDPSSYTFEKGFTVQNKRDLTIPESLVLSQTMLVKWQIRNLAKGVTIDQIPPAYLSSSLEIPGLGVLDGVDHQISASQQGRDRVQLITLDPSLPHKFLFHQVSDLVTNSVLEFYTSDLEMATFNNPVNISTDLSPVVNAIAAGSAAQVAAAQAIATSPGLVTKRLVEVPYAPIPWSGRPKDHVAVTPDPARIGGSIFNSTKNPIAVDQYLDLATKGSSPQHDGIIQPGGSYDLTAIDAAMGVMLYTLDGSKPPAVTINLLYPQPAPVAAPPSV
jgi:hypothetical protein